MSLKRERIADVYFSSLPDAPPSVLLLSERRREELRSVSNERVVREKYYVWRLLEYALKKSLDVDVAGLRFEKGDNGRWSTTGCEFSLSHSGGAIAVAVSTKKIGVDVERLRIKRADNFAEYILTDAEKREYSSLSDESKEAFLTRKWCEKEAVFKSLDEAAFLPSKIEVSDFPHASEEIELAGEKYILAVAGEYIDELEFFCVEPDALL